MSDLSDFIEEDRAERRSKRTARMTRKGRHTARKRPSEPGGVILRCGCRWIYSGGSWRHVTPCRADWLRDKPVGDQEMLTLLGAAAPPVSAGAKLGAIEALLAERGSVSAVEGLAIIRGGDGS